MGGGFKGALVGGGGESGSARPETDGGQHWALPLLTKGSGTVRPQQKGKRKPPRGPIRSAATMASFTGRPGAPPRLPASTGRRSSPAPRGSGAPGAAPLRAPQGGVLGGGAAAGGGGSGPTALGGSRRGWCSDAELCAGEERDARDSGEEGGGRGGRGESRCKAAAGEAGALAAGGRRWHWLREPRLLRFEFPNRAGRSGSPAPTRPLPAPGSGPFGRARSFCPFRLARSGSHSRKKAENRQELPRRSRPRVQADTQPRRRAVCARVCRALAPCLAHA